MTENDYIAEYVKEKHEGLLGFDFAMWKLRRAVSDSVTKLADALSDVFKDMPEEEIEKYVKQDEDEEDEDNSEKQYSDSESYRENSKLL